MNIREAKEDIKRTVWAYTARTEAGALRIPVKRQRPVLLIGPPGIGKTAIVEQIARECSLGLVAYTMTHHTRQSAIGLPVLRQREFQGREYTVTAYTMSEIIASVYQQVEEAGRREGILFLDEINCVSETLMPAMLQFLQYKAFGSHRLPEGWVIVAAGNPYAYNRSVREFDIVTLDRVKKMEVEADLEVWKAYALGRGLHPAVLSFLELRPECFYVCDPGKKGFVTGRSWEDLSQMLEALEALELPVEDTLFGQYLQEEETARLFSFYYRLYGKWRQKLSPAEDGGEKFPIDAAEAGGQRFVIDSAEAGNLPFDERLCILWLLLWRLYGMAASLDEQERFSQSLQYFSEGMERESPEAAGDRGWEQLCLERLEQRARGLAVRKEHGLLDEGEEEREKRIAGWIRKSLERRRLSGEEEGFAAGAQRERRKAEEAQAALAGELEQGIAFVRRTFGEGRELLIFLTNLIEHPQTARVFRDCLPEEYGAALECLQTERREEELRRRL